MTRRGDGRPSLTASVEGGSFRTAAGRVALGMGGDRYDLRVSGQGVTSDGLSVASRKRGNTERDGYRNGTLSAKLGLRPSETTEISLTGRYTRFRTDTDAFVGGQGAVDAPDYTTGHQLAGRIQGKAALLDGRWEHIAGLSVTDHRRNYHEGGMTSRYDGTRTKLDYQTNLTMRTEPLLPAEHVFTLAAEHETDKATTRSSFSDFDRSIGSTGLVAQYRLALFDRLSLTGGLRHDDNELFKDATTWRTTAAYVLDGTGTKLRASYGTGVKNPSLFELYGHTQGYQGNPNLKPERATGWDAGFDQPLWGGRVAIDGTWFAQRIEDLITGAGRTSVNMPGTSRVRGIEAGLTAELMADLFLRGSYTFTDGEDSEGFALYRRPKHQASLNVNYRFLDDRADANLGILYTGRRTDWDYDAAYNRSVVNLPPYVLVNLAGSYKVTERLEIFGRVENLFNRQYEEVLTYGTAGRAGYLGLRLSL